MYHSLIFAILFFQNVFYLSEATQPNLIVLVADDMGFNDVSFRGSNLIPTPNIDALAYAGRILNHHYAPPICTPSRSAFFTGLHPIKLGTQEYVILGGQPSGVSLKHKLLPEYLQDLNYSTHLIGKWHLGYPTEGYLPGHRGFDTFLGFYNGLTGYYKLDYNETLIDQGVQKQFRGFDLHDETGKPKWDYLGKYSTDVFADEACDVIARHNASKGPLYLHVAFNAPHTGTNVGNGLETPIDIDVNTTFSKIKLYERRLYAGIMKRLDQSVGKIVKELSRSELLKNSVILFIADHGAPAASVAPLPANYGSNWPLRGSKMTLYEGGVRTAAVLWSPLLKGSLLDEQFYHVTDWLPTLISAAGGNPENLDIDGISQWAALQGKKNGPRSNILLNIDEENNSEAILIDSRWKIVKQRRQNLGNLDYHVRGQEETSIEGFSELLTRILTSPTWTEITNFTSVTPVDIFKKRKQASLRCDVTDWIPLGNAAPSTDFFCEDYCLFDVLADPCETHKVTDRKDLIEKGVAFLNKWRQDVIRPFNATTDPKSNPAQFGGVWTPWLHDDKSENIV